MKNFLISTLNYYLFKNYVMNFLMLLFSLLALIYVFDVVDLLRRAADTDGVSLVTVLGLGLYKLPEVGQQLFTFAILFSGILTFWQLTKNHELVILRAAGLSVWQFIVPIIIAALLIGVIKITMVNPLSVLLLSRYESLETEYFDKSQNPISISKDGLWLRQDYKQGSAILHAAEIKMPMWLLEKVTIFITDESDRFVERYDAKQATLKDNKWNLTEVVLNKATSSGSVSLPSLAPTPQKYENAALPTSMTLDQLENSFSSVDTISFWAFPAHIDALQEAGFNTNPLKIHFQSLLAQPLLFMSMILLAASVSMQSSRTNNTLKLIVMGIGIGFIIFFTSSFLQALGASAQIPLFVAAWFPAIITFLLGIGVLMTIEDG